MIAALLAFFGKFVADIFGQVINKQLSSPAAKIIVKRYEGKIHAQKSRASRILAKYGRLRVNRD